MTQNALVLGTHVERRFAELSAEVEWTPARAVAMRALVAPASVQTRVWHVARVDVWNAGAVWVLTAGLARRVNVVQCNAVLAEWTRNGQARIYNARIMMMMMMMMRSQSYHKRKKGDDIRNTMYSSVDFV